MDSAEVKAAEHIADHQELEEYMIVPAVEARKTVEVGAAAAGRDTEEWLIETRQNGAGLTGSPGSVRPEDHANNLLALGDAKDRGSVQRHGPQLESLPRACGAGGDWVECVAHSRQRVVGLYPLHLQG